MGTITLADFKARVDRGEKFKVEVPNDTGGTDTLELTLRSPTREQAEQVAGGITAAGVLDTKSDAVLKSLHMGLLFICPDIDDGTVVPIMAAGGDRLHAKILEMCGLAPRMADGTVADDSGNGSPSGTH